MRAIGCAVLAVLWLTTCGPTECDKDNTGCGVAVIKVCDAPLLIGGTLQIEVNAQDTRGLYPVEVLDAGSSDPGVMTVRPGQAIGKLKVEGVSAGSAKLLVVAKGWPELVFPYPFQVLDGGAADAGALMADAGTCSFITRQPDFR